MRIERMMPAAGRFGLLVGCALLALSGRAPAADVPPRHGFGHLTAITSGASLPQRATISVETPSGTIADHPEMYAAARSVMEKFLVQRGFRLAAKGDFTMRVRITATAYGRDYTELYPAVPERWQPELDVEAVDQIRVPLAPPAPTRPAKYAVAVSLFRAGESPVWTGNAEAATETRDPEALVQRMTGALTTVFGVNAERDFAIDCRGETGPGGVCL